MNLNVVGSRDFSEVCSFFQSKYGAAHPKKAFACELPRLRPRNKQGADYNPFEVSDNTDVCWLHHADASGVIARHQPTAAVRGATGFKAFCTDESGVLWYGAAGSAADCLASRRSLE
jgi:hypothetical protein